MELPSLTTELEAVNAILASVGESPVVTLEEAFTDAQMARDLLSQRLRAVQLQGWTFNTDLNVVLNPDTQGRIFVSPTLLSYDIADTNVVVRGSRLYNRSTQSYEFAEPVTATNVVTLLPFDECPEAMRLFATIAAGRRFQDRYQGSESLHQFHARDEISAWAALLNYEASVAKWNVLTGLSTIQRIKQNR